MMPLAHFLVTYRQRKGLSQEELAAAAQLSLRTVQRIENGETVPRGFTLQALASALQLPVEALTVPLAEPAEPSTLPPPTPDSSGDAARSYVVLLNLSAFSYWLLPGANIALPWWLWQRQKHIPEIREAGRRLLNFQLLWTAITYGGFLLLLAAQVGLIFMGYAWLVFTPIVFLCSLYALHALLLSWAAWRASRGNFSSHPVGIPLF